MRVRVVRDPAARPVRHASSYLRAAVLQGEAVRTCGGPFVPLRGLPAVHRACGEAVRGRARDSKGGAVRVEGHQVQQRVWEDEEVRRACVPSFVSRWAV